VLQVDEGAPVLGAGGDGLAHARAVDGIKLKQWTMF
jgi:hypothetical protein